MVFLFVLTLWSLACQGAVFWSRRVTAAGAQAPAMWINFIVTLALGGLALFLILEAWRALRTRDQSWKAATTTSS